MVCVSEATFPGCMIDVKPLVLFRMEDDQGIDDKVLAVPPTDPGWNTLESLDEVPDQLQSEIAHFFAAREQARRDRGLVLVGGRGVRDRGLAQAISRGHVPLVI
jgi:inorganic pyrophosphatase